ncbi:MAG: phosphatidylglycerophosphatase A [Candidatus Omnitrophica bacterium]|nr:phosphatidylglycerophosphatase A [Candidatus Omnitrophota bacterium]
MQKISKLFATVFYVGFVPVAPGTVASLLGVLLYLAVRNHPALYFSLTAILLAVGFWSSTVAEKNFSKKDPREIVIDEFSSVLLIYLFIPFSLKFLIIGFLLFRFFDIVKIPPIKKLEALPGGLGIMLDDIAAAVLANLILQVIRLF